MIFIMGTKSRNNVGPLGKAVAKKLEEIRKERGISQREIEDKTQISQSQLSKMLRGIRAINLDELESICVSLSTSIDEVLTESEIAVAKHSVSDLDARREAKAATESAEPDYDAIVDGINAGTEKFAAQKATEPLEEHWP